MKKELRIFKNVNNTYDNDGEGVLKIKQDEIVKRAYVGGGYQFLVHKDDIENLDSYRDVGDLYLNENEMTDFFLITPEDMKYVGVGESIFHLLKEYRHCEDFEEARKEFNLNEDTDDFKPITSQDLENFFNKLENDWLEPSHYMELVEFYEYWDGSNNKQVALGGECPDYVEVEEEERDDYLTKEELDEKNHGTYENKLVITESNKKAVITISFMQGDISEGWQFVDEDINSIDEIY